MPATSQGKLVVVSGPSGAGKTSVMQRVFAACRLPLVRSVSVTTRPPRNGETDGVDYHFVSDDEFQERRKRGEFLECFEVFGHGYWYGTLWSEVTTGLAAGKWVVLEIDVQGAPGRSGAVPRGNDDLSPPPLGRCWSIVSAVGAPRPKRPSNGGWPRPSGNWPRPAVISIRSSTTTSTRPSRIFVAS